MLSPPFVLMLISIAFPLFLISFQQIFEIAWPNLILWQIRVSGVVGWNRRLKVWINKEALKWKLKHFTSQLLIESIWLNISWLALILSLLYVYMRGYGAPLFRSSVVRHGFRCFHACPFISKANVPAFQWKSCCSG